MWCSVRRFQVLARRGEAGVGGAGTSRLQPGGRRDTAPPTSPRLPHQFGRVGCVEAGGVRQGPVT